jgi:hypothetical protein
MFDRIAVTRAEMPKAMLIKNQKTAPRRSRNPTSWQAFINANPETSNCPAIDFQLAPITKYMVISGFPLRFFTAERAIATVECPAH